MNFVGKRLLILGGAAQCCKVVETAKRMGIYTIVADMANNCPAKTIADEGILFSLTDVDGLLEWCHKNPVDGIINFCFDIAQNTHRVLCEKLGFPVFGNEEQYEIFTNKDRFKEICKENRLDVIPEYSIDDLESISYPVIVKPASGSGSKGIYKCNDEQELLERYKKACLEFSGNRVIIEKYLSDQQEFTLFYVVVDGEPHLVRTMDRHHGSVEDNLDRQLLCGRSPSIYSETVIQRYNLLVKKMIKKVGLLFAPCLMQCFIDGERILFNDPGLRFPGLDYERLYKRVTGIDLVGVFIKYCLGEKVQLQIPSDSYLLDGKCVAMLCVDLKPGTIGEIRGVNELLDIPYVVNAMQKHNIGYVVPDTNDVNRRVLEIDFICPNDFEAISTVIKTISEVLVINDNNGDSMLTSFIQPELLVKRN